LSDSARDALRTLVPHRPGWLRVLLIGSYDQEFLNFISAQQGYSFQSILDSNDIAATASELDFDIIFTGLKIAPLDGMEVLKAFREADPDAPLIMSTHNTCPRNIVEVMQAGAFEYLVEPYQNYELIADILRRAGAQRRSLLAARKLSAQLHGQSEMPELVGASKSISLLRKSVRRAAGVDSPVLITGESGTGKGLIASLIHKISPRGQKKIVTANCGAIPEQLFETELFGHVRGAFTGAVANRKGRVQEAEGGTLFLDEIAELSPAAQAKLLRLLEERTYERVGESSPLTANVRIICATNKNLPTLISGGLFREDLFYRVNVLPLEIPPLRQHRDDIPLLAQHFLETMASNSGKSTRAFSARSLKLLAAHDWPGNARELRNVIERAFVFSAGETILARDIPSDLVKRVALESKLQQAPPAAGLRQSLRQQERRMILVALEQSDWVRTAAARLLQIPRTSLIRKMRDLKITQ
jgi:DNA-binding NtrC family response regulator